MAQSGRELVCAFAELIGLPANRVAGLTLDASARNGILETHVSMYPELTAEEIQTFSDTLRQYGSQLIVHVKPARTEHTEAQ